MDIIIMPNGAMRGLVLAVFMPLLGLSGCATGPSLQSRLAVYIGAPEAELVHSLGVPDKQIEVKGVQYLAYQVRYQVQSTPVMPPFGPYWYNPMPQMVQVWACEATFVLAEGKVQSFSLRGNDCT